MTTPPPPLISDQATEDQIGLAVRAVGAAFCTAISWLGFVTWGTLAVAGPDAAVPAGQIDPGSAHVNLLLYGFSSCLAVTGLVGWRLLRPVGSTWRRSRPPAHAARSGSSWSPQPPSLSAASWC